MSDLKTVKLKKIIQSKPQYGYNASATSKNTGTRFLRITDIQNNNVDWDSIPFCNIEGKDVDKYLLKKNDIVFARTGATTGKTYLIQNNPKDRTVFASYLIRIRPDDLIYPRFLDYSFKTIAYWNQIQTRGGVKPNFNAQKLQEILVTVPFKNGNPDLEEQKRIADKIDKLFTEVHKGEQNIKTILEDFEDLKKSTLIQAFEGKL